MQRFAVIVSTLVLMVMSTFVVRAEIYSLDEARQLFNDGHYSEAALTFQRELKKKSNNGSLNYYYGVCLYHMGDYPEAIKCLTKAVSKKVHKAHFYLGEIYVNTYRFEDAVKAYEEYEATLDNDTITRDVAQRVAMSKLGARMMRGVEKVQVIDTIEVDSLAFFEFYKLSPEAGRVMNSTHLPFEMEADTPVVAYVPQRNDVVYMGYKGDGKQYDLYQSSQLLGDEWSELLPLSENLNNENNQSYPYLLADGQTLYFAQDGDASLGGYDIFVTMFNSELGDYMLPQNVGMPFNSPYNDYMMAIDETMGVGWFVSDRNHIPGKLTIYIFIPNDAKKVYQDVEQEQLAVLAQLSDIKATWQSDSTGYVELLDAVSKIEVKTEVVAKQELYFVVNDDLVYTQAADFRNKQALAYFYQAQTLQRKIDERDARLQQLRQQYMLAKPAQREQLSAQILELEALILEDTETPLVYENRARRAELSYLNLLDE